MKKEIAIGLGALVMASAGAYYGSSVAAAAGPAMSDTQFVAAVQKGNDDEIAEARYVLGMTKSPAVRRFANEMISDHSQANVSLIKAARNAHVPLPQQERLAERRAAPAMLAGLTEPQLDQTYMKGQVDGHQMMLDAVTAEAGNAAADPSLKTYASDLQPTVQKHLDLAKNIIDLAPNGDTGPNLNVPAMSSSGAPQPAGAQPGPVTSAVIPTASPAGPMPSGAPPSGAPPSHAP